MSQHVQRTHTRVPADGTRVSGRLACSPRRGCWGATQARGAQAQAALMHPAVAVPGGWQRVLSQGQLSAGQAWAPARISSERSSVAVFPWLLSPGTGFGETDPTRRRGSSRGLDQGFGDLEGEVGTPRTQARGLQRARPKASARPRPAGTPPGLRFPCGTRRRRPGPRGERSSWRPPRGFRGPGHPSGLLPGLCTNSTASAAAQRGHVEGETRSLRFGGASAAEGPLVPLAGRRRRQLAGASAGRSLNRRSEKPGAGDTASCPATLTAVLRAGHLRPLLRLPGLGLREPCGRGLLGAWPPSQRSQGCPFTQVPAPGLWATLQGCPPRPPKHL